MDYSETLVENYLQYKGFSKIIYEPDGNIPPDFLVNDEIAIEVRRLNQNIEGNGKTKGLEETAYPLFQRIDKLFRGHKRESGKNSLFYSIRFARPVSKWKRIEEKIEEYISIVKSGRIEVYKEYKISDNLSIKFLPSSKEYDELFIPGAYSDSDSVGWVISEMLKNLRICISEKERKIEKYRAKYPEWWLVMIDYIGYGLEETDKIQLKENFNINHKWNRVILLDPLNIEHEFEI